MVERWGSWCPQEAERRFGGPRAYTPLTAEDVAAAVMAAVATPDTVQMEEITLTPTGYTKK